MNIRKFIGTLIMIAGLETVVGTIVLSQGFAPTGYSAALVMAGFAAVVIGYSIAGWHRPRKVWSSQGGSDPGWRIVRTDGGERMVGLVDRDGNLAPLQVREDQGAEIARNIQLNIGGSWTTIERPRGG